MQKQNTVILQQCIFKSIAETVKSDKVRNFTITFITIKSEFSYSDDLVNLLLSMEKPLLHSTLTGESLEIMKLSSYWAQQRNTGGNQRWRQAMDAKRHASPGLRSQFETVSERRCFFKGKENMKSANYDLEPLT